MADRNKTNVTEGEFEILTVLWDKGPSTVREVYESLPRRRTVGYTTVLKLMQIMHEKKLVERDESSRSHVYSATVDRAETQGSMVDDLIQRVFAGSSANLVLRALASSRTTVKELDAIRAAIKKAKEEKS